MTLHDRRSTARDERWRRAAAWQGRYFVATGAWPLFHLRSFEAVTGPKPEGWLVKMVGLLAAAIGGSLLMGVRRGKISPELRWLGLSSAAAFAAVDTWYAGRRRIAPVYLLDAVVEAAFMVAWRGPRAA
jgi:hypothetical protein